MNKGEKEMRVYSDLLKKPFDTEEEANEAEEAYKAEQELKAKEAEEKEVTKKAMAKEVENAEHELDAAYDEFEATKEKIRVMLEEQNKVMEDMLSEAREKVKKAERKKFEAIAAYNKKYGVYTVFYDSNKTSDAVKKRLAKLDQYWNDLFGFWF